MFLRSGIANWLIPHSEKNERHSIYERFSANMVEIFPVLFEICLPLTYIPYLFSDVRILLLCSVNILLCLYRNGAISHEVDLYELLFYSSLLRLI